MALTRRDFMVSLPLGAAALFGCSGAVRTAATRAPYVEISSFRPRESGRGTILVCMPETAQTREVWVGLSDELREDFALVALRVEGRRDAPAIAQAMHRHRPSGIVLMNNPTVAAYRDYQRTAKPTEFPPAVIVMTSFLEGQTTNVVRATGISYEVPLITVVTNLRKLVATPIERVGVVVRAPLVGFVHRQVALALREQIQVTVETLSGDPNASELKRALRRIKHRADAVWVLNDDRLLTTRLIADAWIPGLEERPFRPAIVGAASLVSSIQSFGTFAVLPDHTALGAQTASLLFDIADNGWTIERTDEPELPLSTTTTVDLTQVRERFLLQEHALAQVDRIVE